MERIEGEYWLKRCRRKRLFYRLGIKALYGISAALVISLLLGVMYTIPWWLSLPGSLLIGLAYACLAGFARPGLQETAFYLDGKFPELEYSSSLYLKQPSSLGVLQRIQLQKIEARVHELSQRPDKDYRALRKPLVLFLLCLSGYALGYNLQHKLLQNTVEEDKLSSNKETCLSPAPAAFTKAALEIRSPAYTGLPVREQNDLSVSAIQGSVVRLRLHTNVAMEDVTLLFNGERIHRMKHVDPLIWESTFPLNENGFYQIEYDGNRSDMYSLEAMPDKPVTISVSRPDPYHSIEPGYAPLVVVEAELSDDFGIKEAILMATIASGKGESVTFKSSEMPFKTNGSRNLNLTRNLDLKKLEMKPGDELFFYIRARDIAAQESRSDVYVVSWQDTTELMSLSGMVSPTDVKPEYFRSQRQIILDIEKLIAESSGLSKKEGQEQSNNIGIDQKLLRLRYGQFLGEEAEGENADDHDDHGHEHGHHEDEQQESVPEDIEILQDQITHHHDRAEDATFFTPSQKAQLKATLTEMWNAELKLRTYMPQQALPYAYKALKLLKDLQQQSRTYVAKAPAKQNQLKPEKRLTGDLTDIVEPKVSIKRPAKDQKTSTETRLRKALADFSNLDQNGKLDASGLQRLSAIQIELIGAATAAPGKYLQALKVAREIEESKGLYNEFQVRVLSTAIQELLPRLYDQPAAKRAAQGESIYQHYLKSISSP